MVGWLVYLMVMFGWHVVFIRFQIFFLLVFVVVVIIIADGCCSHCCCCSYCVLLLLLMLSRVFRRLDVESFSLSLSCCIFSTQAQCTVGKK